VPTVSRFFGIEIWFYFNDHLPPHFHAKYESSEALYSIRTLQVLEGGIPRRAHNLVLEWADLHRAELLADWELARAGQALTDIAPLE